MNNNRFHSFTISLNRTSLRRIIALFIIGMIVLFVCAGIITTIDNGRSFASDKVYHWTSEMKGEHFLHIIGMENEYFKQALPTNSERLKLSHIAFAIMTSVHLDDPRSLLGRELPGFALYDARIVIAGDGTDYTNLPVESAPPMEVLMAEREATKESLAKLEQLEKEGELLDTTSGKKVVHIIHTHNYESFLPELETDVANEAHHSQINVTLVGEKLSQELEKRGIGARLEKRDIQAHVKEKRLSYNESYDASREFIQEVIAQEDHLEFFFDIHRDSQRRDKTTTTIDGLEYAKVVFVIGGNQANYKENSHLAEELHHLLEEKYPTLSRGVIIKEGSRTNGKFNQDLSTKSLLIEIGGIDNSLEETYRTAEALAEVFANYYWKDEAIPVSKGEE